MSILWVGNDTQYLGAAFASKINPRLTRSWIRSTTVKTNSSSFSKLTRQADTVYMCMSLLAHQLIFWMDVFKYNFISNKTSYNLHLYQLYSGLNLPHYIISVLWSFVPCIYWWFYSHNPQARTPPIEWVHKYECMYSNSSIFGLFQKQHKPYPPLTIRRAKMRIFSLGFGVKKARKTTANLTVLHKGDMLRITIYFWRAILTLHYKFKDLFQPQSADSALWPMDLFHSL